MNDSINILCFEWKIGIFEIVRIFTHYKILAIGSKKERNHDNLKESENYCRTKTFPKRGWKRGKADFL